MSSSYKNQRRMPTNLCRLRLAIFKGMGFEPIVEKDGSINKMLVRAYSFVLQFFQILNVLHQAHSLGMFISSTFLMAKLILNTLNSFGGWSIPNLYFVAYNRLFIIIKNNMKGVRHITLDYAMMPEAAIE